MLDIGIIGTGMATKSWYLPELSSMQGVRIKAISTDILDDKFVELFSDGGMQIPEFFVGKTAWVDLLESDLDAVIVATPNHLHAPIALAAINRGIHVLVEKPVCLNMEEGRALLEAESSHDSGIVAVAYKHRYSPNRIKAKELLKSSLFGPINEISAIIGHRGPQLWSPGAGWFFDRDFAGGGCLMDLGPHIFDDLLFISGEKVIACIEADVEYMDDIDVKVQARYTLAHGNEFSLLTSWQFPEYQDLIKIDCENGWIEVVNGGQLRWEINGLEQEETLTHSTNDADIYDSGVCEGFVNAVLNASPGDNLPTLTEGVYGVAAIEAAYNFSRTGTLCKV